jgi:hypothetical protein
MSFLLSGGLRDATSWRLSLQNTINAFGGRSTLSTLIVPENNIVKLNLDLPDMRPDGGGGERLAPLLFFSAADGDQ